MGLVPTVNCQPIMRLMVSLWALVVAVKETPATEAAVAVSAGPRNRAQKTADLKSERVGSASGRGRRWASEAVRAERSEAKPVFMKIWGNLDRSWMVRRVGVEFYRADFPQRVVCGPLRPDTARGAGMPQSGPRSVQKFDYNGIC